MDPRSLSGRGSLWVTAGGLLASISVDRRERDSVVLINEFVIRRLRGMKNLTLVSLLVFVSLSSCTSGPNARTGTAVGALGGAAAGGLIGRSLGGAAVGAGIGALGGNVIGGAQDERNRSNDGHR